MRLLLYILFTWVATAGTLYAVPAGQVMAGTPNHGVRFTENKNQWHPQILYKAKVPNGTMLLEKNAFRFFLYSPDDMEKIHHPGTPGPVMVNSHAVLEEFVGANPQCVVEGNRPFPDYANYFIGNNPDYWAGNVKIYGGVRYKELYNGIDLVVYTREGVEVKYDFVLKPGAAASNIKVRYHGADKLMLKPNGLHVVTSVGTVVESHPVAYQVIDGRKMQVPCNFALSGSDVSFVFPKGYNTAYELVIDPTLVFSTYMGSTADNWGYTATYDDQGNMYVGGYVNAEAPLGSNYFTTPGAFQTFFGGGSGGNQGNGNGIAFACDMGISKLSPNGSQMIYSTYIGGNDNETPHSLVVDPSGNLIIYGVSYSPNYPVTAGAYDNSHNGMGDIVVTKLNAAGSALLGSTFVGGGFDDGLNFDPQEFTSGNLKRNYGDQNRGEVNLDAQGNIFIASCTKSADFPVTGGALQSTFGGSQDGCAFKISADCSQLIWSTFLGGSNDDACYSLDPGPAGTLYVTGGTMSNNFPTTNSVLHSTYQGGLYDGFLAHINANGTQLLASTYVGTSGNDQVYFVKLDGPGDVYIVGQTTGAYPVSNALYVNPGSGQFIVKLNPALNSVFYSTVFGNGSGAPNISPTAFLVDTCENVYVAGWGTNSGSFPGFTNNMFNMPLTQDAAQKTTDGTDFYFFVISKNAQSLLYASYFGGAGAIEHVDGGTSRFDKRGVIYQAICAGCGGGNSPTTQGSWSPNNPSQNCNLLGLKIEFNLAGTAVEIDAYPRATGCVPLTVNFTGTINNAQSFFWDLGDGSTSQVQNPVHTYTDTGTYTVMLVGVDSNSCNLSDTAYVEVWVRDDSLSADFTPDLIIDCDSNKVSLSSVNYGSTQFNWNMGDGTVYNTQTINHYYNNWGSYTITLTVSDTSKCSLADTFSAPVFIPYTVDASFNLSDSFGCAPLQITYTAPPSATAQYNWVLGDGSTAVGNPVTHLYSQAGAYSVTLIVTDTTSCNLADTALSLITLIDSSADAGFHFERIFYGCDSVYVIAWSDYVGEDSQLWDLGNGITATTDTIRYMYNVGGTYTITHTVTDVDMVCKPMDTAMISVSLSPVNSFISLPDTGGCLPFTAQFTGNSNLLTTNYYWFFGDGSSDTGKNVSHTYTATGTYTAIMIAIDSNACVDADTVTAQIVVVNDSAIAGFVMNVLNDCDSNLLVDLQNTSVNALNYLWDFGDGTTSTALNESHTYNLPGTYTITLMVSDTNRCHPYDTISQTVTMLPNTTLSFSVNNVCLGDAVVFENYSNPSAQFSWNFGDNTTSQQFEPSHQYAQPNTYTVRLIMVDSSTCNVTDTAFRSVKVSQQPQANFVVTNDTFLFETPVAFRNKSLHYEELIWDLGDGTILTNEEEFEHVYDDKIGWVKVCLVAVNEPCYDTVCKDIFIWYKAIIGVPNAFSPNGDGVNDVVRVEGKGIVKLVFRIYNRWGEKVFESNDKNIGWDGYYKGELQEMDVFTYWVLADLIDGQTVPLKGNITLLR